MKMTGIARRIGMGLLACALVGAAATAQGWQHLGKVQRVEKLKDGVELAYGTAKVRITAFNDGVFRVRLAPTGAFPKDSSWAVIASPDPPTLKIEENQKEIRIITGRLIATIQKSLLLIDFSDAAGNVLLADEPTLPMAWNGQRVHAWKKMPQSLLH
jgi:alpha-glucosidase